MNNVFTVGDVVPYSGVYRITHYPPHTGEEALTLTKGSTFPHCVHCSHISFMLIHQSTNSERITLRYPYEGSGGPKENPMTKNAQNRSSASRNRESQSGSGSQQQMNRVPQFGSSSNMSGTQSSSSGASIPGSLSDRVDIPGVISHRV